MSRYVAYSDEAGVYLGSCLGFGFWSAWDAVGQTHACTFADEAEWGEFRNSIDDASTLPSVRLVSVNPTDGNYASIEDCVAAGLPGWTP